MKNNRFLLKMFVIVVMMVIGGSVWATQVTYTYTFDKNVWKSSGETANLAGIDWAVEYKGGGISISFNAADGMHFGTNSNPCNELTISTSGFQGTISSIVVEAKRGTSLVGTLSVSVGKTAYTTESNTGLTSTFEKYEYTGSKSGEVNIQWKRTTKISSSKGGVYIKSITVTYDTENVVTVGDAGYSTYCHSTKKLMIGDGTVTSIITGVDANGIIQTKNGKVVPAGVGVLLTGKGTYGIYTSNNLVADDVTGNCLVGVADEDIDAPVGSYVLQNHEGTVAFYRVGDEVQPKVKVGRAYLDLSSLDAKDRVVYFGIPSEPVSVQAITPKVDDEIEAVYTLNGVRVGALQRGLNIVKMKSGRTEKRFVP